MFKNVQAFVRDLCFLCMAILFFRAAYDQYVHSDWVPMFACMFTGCVSMVSMAVGVMDHFSEELKSLQKKMSSMRRQEF